MKEMTVPEIITAAIAGAALAISLVSLYFSTFRKKVSMVACLASWNTRDAENPLDQLCEIALSNTGTVELLVREALVDLTPGLDHEYLVPRIDCNDLPRVLKPGEMALISLPVASLFVQEAAAKSQRMELTFHIFTPSGELRLASKTITPNARDAGPKPGSDDWKPFGLEKVRN